MTVVLSWLKNQDQKNADSTVQGRLHLQERAELNRKTRSGQKQGPGNQGESEQGGSEVGAGLVLTRGIKSRKRSLLESSEVGASQRLPVIRLGVVAG